MPTLETDQLLAAAVDACDSKKAEDIRILALDASESALTDYFLICNGTNDRQNVAISDEIEYRLKHDFGVYPNSVEGRRQGEWVLMDYVDFVVHIFLPETRAHYGLERLKKSATQLTLAQLQTEIKARMANLAKARAKAPAKTAPTKKATPVKAAIKKAPAKKVATKAVAKKTTVKNPAKKAPTKKAAAKKSLAKR